MNEPELQSDLTERAVAGDGEALARLLEATAPLVRQSLEGKIPPRWRAVLTVDDVMQETYIDAFLDIGRFEPRGDGAFRAWLTTLARRNLLDAIRMFEADKRGRGRRRVTPKTDQPLTALYDQIQMVTTTPSRLAAQAEAGDRLEKAVAQLPETYRTVVRLYDLEGQPVETVAATLDRSPGAVFMLRARAHRQIGEILGRPSQFLSGTG